MATKPKTAKKIRTGPTADDIRGALARAEEATRLCAEVCTRDLLVDADIARASDVERRAWERVYVLVAMASGVEEGPAAVILDGRVLALIPPDAEGGNSIEAVHEFSRVVSVPASAVAAP
jgi:hypothetical protein